MQKALGNFSGLFNTADPKAMPEGALIVADNIDISKTKLICRRNGYTKRATTSSAVSSYVTRDKSRFFILDDGKVYRVNTDLTLNALGDATANSQVCWDDNVNYTVASNGILINPDNTLLALKVPAPDQPQVNVTTGYLTPGQYQVAVTYADKTGREGPTSNVRAIQLDADQGLTLTIALIPDHTAKLYISETDGDVLYWVEESTEQDANQWTYLVDRNPSLSISLDNKQLLCSELPDGITQLAFFEGKLFVATQYAGHAFIFFSQEYWWHLYNTKQDYLTLEGRVVAMRATAQGLVIGTETQIWVYAQDLLTKLADYGMVAGSSITIDSENNVIAWTTRGICSLFPFQNMTHERYSFNPGSHVQTAIVNQDGNKKIMVLTNDTGAPYNAF